MEHEKFYFILFPTIVPNNFFSLQVSESSFRNSFFPRTCTIRERLSTKLFRSLPLPLGIIDQARTSKHTYRSPFQKLAQKANAVNEAACTSRAAIDPHTRN